MVDASVPQIYLYKQIFTVYKLLSQNMLTFFITMSSMNAENKMLSIKYALYYLIYGTMGITVVNYNKLCSNMFNLLLKCCQK